MVPPFHQTAASQLPQPFREQVSDADSNCQQPAEGDGKHRAGNEPSDQICASEDGRGRHADAQAQQDGQKSIERDDEFGQ